MGKFTKNNFLNTFNKIKEFFRHSTSHLEANQLANLTRLANKSACNLGFQSNQKSKKKGQKFRGEKWGGFYYDTPPSKLPPTTGKFWGYFLNQ